ncbi:hypothetical protein AX14_005785 [Amanita brunnescens Koide BX004]|nr:hypothetical protein AX14_005785 [Amanita brunnescens Koide BX004]
MAWPPSLRSSATNGKHWQDFDESTVGAFVTQRLLAAPISFIHWNVVPAANFPGGIPQVKNAVVEQEAWLAVTIAPGITAQLNASLDSPDASYNASQAVMVLGDEARNENFYRMLLRPDITILLESITTEFAVQFAKGHAANRNLASIIATSPQTIVEPVGFVVTTVRAFDIPVASANMFIGLVYLTVISFAIVAMSYNLRERSGLNRLLKFRSLVLVRLTTSCVVYFFLSLCYILVNRAFQINMNRKFGRAGFFILWMLHWSGMMALGGAIESLMPLLTPRFIAYFLLLWIICDVSVVQWPIPLLPSIYRYGYGSPFYNLSIGTRTIYFSIKDEIGLNIGILIVWTAISCITLTLIQYYIRRRDIRANQGPFQNDLEKTEHIVSFAET